MVHEFFIVGSLPEVTPEKQPPDWYKLPLPRVAMFEVQD